MQAGRCTPTTELQVSGPGVETGTAEVGSGWLGRLVTEEGGSRGQGPTIEAEITEFDWGWSAEFVPYGAGLDPVIGAETWADLDSRSSPWLFTSVGSAARAGAADVGLSGLAGLVSGEVRSLRPGPVTGGVDSEDEDSELDSLETERRRGKEAFETESSLLPRLFLLE